jgi:phenylacetate-CoA ligase
MSFSRPDQWLRRQTAFSAVVLAGALRRALTASDRTYRLLFLPGFEGVRWRFGKWRAWRAYVHARRAVPAYRDFLAERGDPRVRARGLDPDLTAIAITDKENYVRRYSIEDRCTGGRIPRAGVVVDESSGTSGTPNNWVRGAEERAEVKQALQVALHHQLGREPIFVLNGFALGPWATGMNVSMSVVDIAILKSTGPDIEKIANTLRVFGPRYRYLITGYPPFLKALVDQADVEWSRYDVTAVYGGEGMSEALRDYLGRVFRNVYGSYGASDLEINIAAENDFTIALRRLLVERPDLLERIGRPEHGVLPMVFQYNPIDYHVEESDEGELVVTLCRRRNAAPKIRYNIGDLGHVVRFPELRRALAGAGLALRDLPEPASDLPLLFLYGRADASVAYYGSKLTPANVEEAVFSLPELAASVASFALLISEDERADKRLAIALELLPEAEARDAETLRGRVLDQLTALNQDFREAVRFMPTEALPTLELHRAGTGPFAGHDVRLKRHYLQHRRATG